MKQKLESRLPVEISITSDRQMTPPLWQKMKRHCRASSWKWKRRVKKLASNSTFKKEIMASDDVTSWQIEGKKWKLTDFIFLGSKITADGDCSHEIKRCLLLGRMANLDSILKSRDITLPTKVHLVKALVFPVVMYGWESCTIKKEGWVPELIFFLTVVLEKTHESQLDCKEILPVHPKGNQSWIFIGRTDGEAETPILWPPDAKNWLIWKDPDAGRDWM